MKKRAENFRQAALAYYFRIAGMDTRFYDLTPIGLPLQTYIPKAAAAVEITDSIKRGKPDRHLELLRNALCEKHDILLFRFMEEWEQEYTEANCVNIFLLGNTDQAFTEAMQAMFKLLGLNPNIDLTRDRSRIRDLIREPNPFPESF